MNSLSLPSSLFRPSVFPTSIYILPSIQLPQQTSWAILDSSCVNPLYLTNKTSKPSLPLYPRCLVSCFSQQDNILLTWPNYSHLCHFLSTTLQWLTTVLRVATEHRPCGDLSWASGHLVPFPSCFNLMCSESCGCWSYHTGPPSVPGLFPMNRTTVSFSTWPAPSHPSSLSFWVLFYRLLPLWFYSLSPLRWDGVLLYSTDTMCLLLSLRSPGYTSSIAFVKNYQLRVFPMKLHAFWGLKLSLVCFIQFLEHRKWWFE